MPGLAGQPQLTRGREQGNGAARSRPPVRSHSKCAVAGFPALGPGSQHGSSELLQGGICAADREASVHCRSPPADSDADCARTRIGLSDHPGHGRVSAFTSRASLRWVAVCPPHSTRPAQMLLLFDPMSRIQYVYGSQKSSETSAKPPPVGRSLLSTARCALPCVAAVHLVEHPCDGDCVHGDVISAE